MKMKKTEKTKKRTRLSLGRKLLYAIVAVGVVAGLSYLAYYLTHYTFFRDYQDYLSSYEYEQGGELDLSGEKLEENKSYELVCQSDALALYLNKDTTDVAILDKRSGVVTYAVPPAAEDDPLANNVNKDYLRSPVILNYYNASRTSGVYDCWSMSVDKGQVEFESIKNGVRVIYEMGDFSDSAGIVPQYMSQEKYDEIMAQLGEDEAAAFGRYYSTTSDVAGMRQLLKTVRNNRIALGRIQTTLESVGFTEDDYVEQMALAGTQVNVPISFKVSLEYRLEDDHVDVSVPTCALEENGGASIYSIQLLYGFNAAGTDEQGYIVVPNGDGSLIYFNNGKTTAGTYSQFVYGIDMLAADYTVMELSNDARMGLFGMCKADSTVLATIEDGASLASVNAGVSGRVNSYNNAYATFIVRGSETLEMFGSTGNEASLPIVEPTPYDRNLTVRYTFLDEDHQGYSGIANYYRDRLIAEGVLTEKTESAPLKFYYDVLAGVKMREFFLGKQYMGLTAMTTFDQAGTISDELAQAGINEQVMNLQGWFNGGYYHDVADRIKVPRKLGGKSGLEDLNALVTANGGSVYADVAFQQVTEISKRYNYQAESAKYYGSGYVADFGVVNPTTLRQTSSLGYSETMYDLISPKFLVRYVDEFADRFADLNVDGMSLRDLGSEVHSDKKRSEMIEREQALDVVKGQLNKLDATGKNVMVNKANDYAWAAADDITDLPLSDNEYVIVDENIPLYEMIVHGCIDYCGSAYNLNDAADARERLLTMIEYGAAPHFLFTWKETSEMKYSGVNRFYSTCFNTWKDTAVEVYSELADVLSPVTGARMLSHEILDEGVRKTVYSNGTAIFVNYNAEPVTVDGVRVPAMGYAVQ